MQVSNPGNDTCNGRVGNYPGEGGSEVEKNPSPVLQGPTDRLDQFKQDVAACPTFDVFRDMLLGRKALLSVWLKSPWTQRDRFAL